jgi:uncharacterized protein (TIGR02246 family)
LAQISRKSRVAFVFGSALGLLALFVVWQFRHASVKEETELSAPKEEGAISQPQQAKTAEKEIAPEATVKELVLAWNRSDAKNISALFVPNGVLITPTGSEIHSRADIQKTISEQRNGMLKETTLTNTVDDVSHPDADTAVVKGTYELQGIKVLGFTSSSTGSYVFRQTKQDGRWLISKAEVTRK